MLAVVLVSLLWGGGGGGGVNSKAPKMGKCRAQKENQAGE